jgi:hypothetical protein
MKQSNLNAFEVWKVVWSGGNYGVYERDGESFYKREDADNRVYVGDINEAESVELIAPNDIVSGP